jgi:nitrogenase molybdenum-iron protein beta chain
MEIWRSTKGDAIMALDGGRFLGAYRACSGIRDAVILSHVPIGCQWGARMLGGFLCHKGKKHACTVLHENEIVFGGESALEKTLLNIGSSYESKVVIVVSGDVPSIIGDDCRSVIGCANLDKKVIHIEAPGIKGSMRDGYEDALLGLAQCMMEQEPNRRSVNLIGFCPDDFKVDADIAEIRRLLIHAGIKVNCIMSCCTYEELLRAPAAELNVVLGQGTMVAEFMKREFGTPYIDADYPYGLKATEELIEKIQDNLDGKSTFPESTILNFRKEIDLESYKKVYLYLNKLYGTPVSVTGDHHARPMAQFLEGDLGFDIAVLSDYHDRHFEDRVNDSNSIMVFGSSFELRIAEELGVPLVRFSYPVFDRVSFSDSPFAGIRGAEVLTECVVNAALSFSDDYILRV